MIADGAERRILVTRPAGQAGALCRLINGHGWQAAAFPCLEIAANPVPQQDWRQAATSDWLIFTSSNAVNFAIKALQDSLPGQAKPQVAAIGQATAKALCAAGWPVDCLPETEFNSEGLLAAPALVEVQGKSCVIVRGVGGLETLAAVLTGRGAKVKVLEVYRRLKPALTAPEIEANLSIHRLHAVTITSGEALHNLLTMLDQNSAKLLKEIPLVVVSGRIKQMAEQLGFERIVISRQPTDSAILETLNTLFNGENSGRSNRTTTR